MVEMTAEGMVEMTAEGMVEMTAEVLVGVTAEATLEGVTAGAGIKHVELLNCGGRTSAILDGHQGYMLW